MDWVPVSNTATLPATSAGGFPEIISRSGRPAELAWADFFDGVIANDLTRVAYNRAVRCFLNSELVCDKQLHEITAADVGKYLREMKG